MKFPIPKLAVLLLAALCFCAPAKAQTVNYIYGIQVGTYTLDQFAVNGSSYSVSSLVNLPTLISGFGGTGRYNESVNALALDPTTNTIFFTYTYNNNATANAGTFTADSYALRYSGSSFALTSLNVLTATAGTADTATKPGGTTVASGWFCRGAFYNGSYYIGVQNEDTLVKMTLAANENSVTGTNVYSNISHGSANTAGEGGDIVIRSGTIWVAGQYTSGASTYTFASESLANAELTTGTAWTSGTVGGYLQLAGLGGITSMYSTVGASGTLNQINNFLNPALATTTPLTLTSGSLASYTDLSDGGSTTSFVTSEPATWVAGILGCAFALGGLVRARKNKNRKFTR